MKKTILPAIALATAGFLFPPFSLSAQTDITVQDDAKVGLIVTGTGNVINTTQIFGKSPEYAELKKRLDGLAAAITKKADDCEQMAKDNLPTKYRDGCRAELIALNAERDSVQKNETRFREDVIRLAETFSKIELNSERLRLAKVLFEEGKIREADNVLNAKEMQQEGDALLAQKERAQQTMQETDSLLRIKADEFALKARLKAIDYANPLRYDTATLYFEQSRRYAETVENLMSFSSLLWRDNQTPLAIVYGEKALQLPLTEIQEGELTKNLGNFYRDVKKKAESEKFFLRSLEIYERLAKSNPVRFEPDLARTCMNLGNLYLDEKMAEAEKMYLRALEIYERWVKSNPAQFEPDLAKTSRNLAIFYSGLTGFNLVMVTDDQIHIIYAQNRNMTESEKMYLHALEIHERLAKSNPAQFEPDLAKTCMNLGNFYGSNQKMAEAEKMYLRALEINKRWVKSNPVRFEPDLALTCMNLGTFYGITNQEMAESEKMYLQALEIHERLAKSNPTQFKPYLASIFGNLSFFYLLAQKFREAEEYAERALALDPAQNWVRINLGHSYLLRGDWDKAKQVYEQHIACEKDPAEAKAALLLDWDAVEKAGVTHPDIEKARKWVKE